MKPRRPRFWSLLLAVLMMLVAAGLWLASREAALNSTEARVTETLEANRRLVVTLRERNTASGASPVRSTTKSATAPQPADPALTGNLARGNHIYTRLRAMAEYAPHERRDLRRQTMRTYGDLFLQLNLSPDRLEQLKRVLDEKFGTNFDLFNSAYAQGYTQSSPEFQQLLKKYCDEAETRIRQVLGPEDYQHYQDYEKSAGWRNGQLTDVRSTLSLQGLPALTGAQESALARAYLESQRWRPAGAEPPPGTLFRLRNDQLGELTRDVLPPAQHAALVDHLAFVNQRTQLLGQLLHPQDPDAFAISIWQQ